MLSGYLKKKVPRTGTLSTVTDGDVTTETFKREDGDSVFVLENGNLRTETEKRKTGLMFTRTWQDGILTSLMVAGSKRTTLVYFDKEGHFLNKIVTTKGEESPACYRYEGKKAVLLENTDCLELIPEFD